MSVNSSSSSNDSLLLPHVSTNSSLSPDALFCIQYSSAFFIFTSFSITNNLLLLPLCILILYLGLQRWWKQPLATVTATTSHTDIFTYHLVTMETMGIIGCTFCCCGNFFSVQWLMILGVYVFFTTSYAEILLHILTCVERHLAVVHPVMYLGLRNRGGVRIRNITIGCVWLIFFGLFALPDVISGSTSATNLSFLVLSLVVICFCSLSVLCVLIRPGPGKQGRDREKVNQSKVRAIHTIMAITGALLFRFGGHLFVLLIYSSALNESFRCSVLMSGVWFCLPSNLVLPLLFLHRAGKLQCSKNKTKPGTKQNF